MEELKITQVSHTYPPYFGGLSHVVDNISRCLAEQGHNVEVVTLDPSNEHPKEECREGVNVNRYPCFAPANSYFFPSVKMYKHLTNLKTDIVHVHNVGTMTVPASWLARRSNKARFIVSPHYHEEGSSWHAKLLWGPYRPIVKKILKSADKIHCVSDFEASLVEKDFKLKPEVIQNGVQEDTFKVQWNPPTGKTVIAYAGRLEPYKRVQNLVKAVSILSKMGQNVVLRIIGDGSEIAHIKNLSTDLNVPFEHYSFLPRNEYLKLLSTSSILVNPSMYEAFSIVVAEALAMGMPVIAARPWGEIFNNHPNMHLVDEASPEEIAEASTKQKTKDSNENQILSWEEVSHLIVERLYKEKSITE